VFIPNKFAVVEEKSMNIKRFVQLFICYLVSMGVAVLVTNVFHISHTWLYVLVASIIGYITLTIPLVVMTMRKNK
jgi:Na+-driven multidrug efflux pump